MPFVADQKWKHLDIELDKCTKSIISSTVFKNCESFWMEDWLYARVADQEWKDLDVELGVRTESIISDYI